MCDIHDSPMGWLRLVGSLKLQVSFAKEPYKRDYTLQKRHDSPMNMCGIRHAHEFELYAISDSKHTNRYTSSMWMILNDTHSHDTDDPE